ncbi:MAG: hypothetical protein V4670_12135 [Bacteroidota bacterium]
MITIEQWFENGSPYNEGVLIYATHPGCNKFLLSKLQKKQTPLLHEKLKYELKKLVSLPKPIAKPTPTLHKVSQPQLIKQAVSVQIEAEEKKQAVLFHQLPPELRPVLMEANTLFREICLLKVQLNELPAHNEKEALRIQLLINSKRKRNQSCWSEIEYYQTHKVLLQKKVDELQLLTPVLLVKKEQLLFSAISKLKKRKAENEKLLDSVSDLNEKNKISRALMKQEENIIIKTEQLDKIKTLING